MLRNLQKLKEIRQNLEEHIKKEVQGFKITSKKDSKLMKALSFLLFFNKSFMTRYISVIGSTMYVPELPWKADDDYSAIVVLAHELKHLQDSREFPIIFELSYLFPQILSIFSVLAVFFGPYWLFCLLFLLPIPSPTRTYWEFRAFVNTLAVYYWFFEDFDDIEHILKQFSGPYYYFMGFGFTWIVKRALQAELKRLREEDLREDLKVLKEIINPSEP